MAFAATLIVLLVFVTLMLYLLWKHLQLRRVIDKIDGPKPYWLVGSALQIKTDSYDWQEQAAGAAELFSNPRMYRIWFFTIPYIVINGAEEAEPIVSNTKHVVKTSDYEFLRPWLGRGLFVNEGEPWRPRRKMMTPVFHGDIIRDFLPVFLRQGRILADRLTDRVNRGPFDVFHYFAACALAVIWESTMGTDLHIQFNGQSEYVQALHRIGDIIYERQRAPWFWPDITFHLFGHGKEHEACIKIIHQTIAEVVERRWKELNHGTEVENQNDNSSSSVLDSYVTRGGFVILDFWLEQVKKAFLTLKDVKEEASSLLFGGYDTTGTSSSWTLHFLGSYPEIQAKVHDELDSVLGRDEDREVSMEDMKNLTYLECCIKESLRLFPPVSIFGRKLVEDAVVAGRRIPAGTRVLVNLYGIHRDPRHWVDPEKFIPERFLSDSSAGRHPYAYMPFSAGIRNCIAQRFAMLEEKVLLASVLRRYEVKSLERPDQVRAKPELVLRPSRVLIELTTRK